MDCFDMYLSMTSFHDYSLVFLTIAVLLADALTR